MQLNDKRLFKLAMTAGIVTLLLSLAFLESKRREYLHLKDPLSVVVAKDDISQDRLLEVGDLSLRQIPREFVEPGAVQKINDALGSVALSAIAKGEQITKAKAASPGQNSGLASFVPEGFRAVSLELDRSSAVAGFVKPGDRVDIIAVFELNFGGAARSSAHIVARSVPILAVGTSVTRRPGLDPEGDANEKGLFAKSSKELRTNLVTFAATPADAQRIALAKETGSISLALEPAASGSSAANERSAGPISLFEMVGAESAMSSNRRFREYRGR